MPVAPTQQILQHAFAKRYGVGALNVVDWVTMDAVLGAERKKLAAQVASFMRVFESEGKAA
jgi:fructose/tagatose bisphosphate aldolase